MASLFFPQRVYGWKDCFLHCHCTKFVFVNCDNKTIFKWKVYKTGAISCAVKESCGLIRKPVQTIQSLLLSKIIFQSKFIASVLLFDLDVQWSLCYNVYIFFKVNLVWNPEEWEKVFFLFYGASVTYFYIFMYFPFTKCLPVYCVDFSSHWIYCTKVEKNYQI